VVSCGPGILGDLIIPDRIFGVDVSVCCMEHDVGYANPEGRSRKKLDKQLLNCLLRRLLAERPANLGRALVRAWVWYAGVRIGGGLFWLKCRKRDKG